MNRYLLEAVVFICGACLMILEIAGSRVLAPYLGASIYVWTSLIGVILGCLSLGYWLGGSMADKKASRKTLSIIILLAAVFIAFAAVLKEYILFFIQSLTDDPRLAGTLAALVLFGVPSILLGIVTPYAVRLKVTSFDSTGAAVGSLYAVSTIGSIMGTFITGFYLIAVLGTTRILLCVAIGLTVASLLLYFKDALEKTCFLMFLLALTGIIHKFNLLPHMHNMQHLVDADTQYSRVWIYDSVDSENGRRLRTMQVNNEDSSCMHVDSGEPDKGYFRFFRLVKHFSPDAEKALMLGGAGLVVSMDFLTRTNGAVIDVVEIDPGLPALAKKYFYPVHPPGLRILYEDGRVFLNRNRHAYDAIFVDVFDSACIPFHLVTLQAVQKIYNSLHEEGVVIANILASLEGANARFLQAAAATYKAVFPQVYLFAVVNTQDGSVLQNVILVALKSSKEPSFESHDEELRSYLKQLVPRDPGVGEMIFTDEYAPVESLQAFKCRNLTGLLLKKIGSFFSST